MGKDTMLEKTARIEHGLNKNIITNLDLYPMIEKDTFECLKLEAKIHQDRSLVYAYMRCFEGKNYVDIYLFDTMREKGYVRFVVSLGEALSMEVEQIFLNYLQSEIYMPSVVLANLEMDVKDKWDIHLNDCEDCRNYLLKLYFSTHQAGVLEILFKMQLDIIALAIDEIEGINLIGTNIEDIFGVPVKFLSKCNTRENLKFIRKEEDRVVAGKIYIMFHNIINSRNILTEFQMKYLYECYEGNMHCDKYLYRQIENIQNVKEWKALLSYFENRNYVSEEYYRFLPVRPQISKIERFKDMCLILEGYEIQDEIYKEKMLLRFRDSKKKYEFYYDDWYVTGPETVYDLVDESSMQRNCLYAYIPRLLYSNNSTILFLRKQSRPAKAWITIEVVADYKIVQALRCKNEPVSPFEYQAIERFAKEKSLIIQLKE